MTMILRVLTLSAALCALSATARAEGYSHRSAQAQGVAITGAVLAPAGPLVTGLGLAALFAGGGPVGSFLTSGGAAATVTGPALLVSGGLVAASDLRARGAPVGRGLGWASAGLFTASAGSMLMWIDGDFNVWGPVTLGLALGGYGVGVGQVVLNHRAAGVTSSAAGPRLQVIPTVARDRAGLALAATW